jgi:hypothetical protein
VRLESHDSTERRALLRCISSSSGVVSGKKVHERVIFKAALMPTD